MSKGKELTILTGTLAIEPGSEFRIYRGEDADGKPILGCLMKKEGGRMALCMTGPTSHSVALGGGEQYIITKAVNPAKAEPVRRRALITATI